MEFADNYKLKILLVDDNTINQFLGKKVFLKLGYEIDLANNGMEAVDYCKTTDCDLIFMDIQMPVLDGIEAAKVILSKEGKKPIIVAITASLFETDKAKCLEVGMLDTLVKPFKIEDLKSTIEKFFKKSSILSNPS